MAIFVRSLSRMKQEMPGQFTGTWDWLGAHCAKVFVGHLFFKFLFVCCWPMTIMFVLDFRCSFVIYGNQYQSIYWLLKIQNSLQQLLICHQYCHCASLWHGNHFPFLAMVLEHLELEGQTWYFYMRYFITRTIAITTTIIAIMIMIRGWSVIEGSDQH